ncbi:MAG: serine/threonine-protein kinase [Planctomycetota bacterium]
MAEAHQNGILHRDLKPANIMIDHRKEPIVMDFGLACQSESNDESRLTQEGTLIGSPAYMPPEQLKGDSIGPATDQYALGVVLFESLSGSLPFKDSASTLTLLTHILTEEPRKLMDLRPNVDPKLCEIAERAISKDTSQRFESMKHFAAALAKFVRAEKTKGQSAPTKQVAASAITQPVAAEVSSATTTPISNPFDNLPTVDTDQVQTFRGPGAHRPRKAPPMLIVAGGCLLLGLVIGISTLAFTGDNDDSASPSGVQETETASATADAGSGTDSSTEPDPVESDSTTARPRGFFKSSGARLLRLFDEDGDQKLSADEIPERERARLMQADYDEDGLLDADELSTLPPPPEPPGRGRFGNDGEESRGPRGRAGGGAGGGFKNRFGEEGAPGGPRNRQRSDASEE